MFPALWRWRQNFFELARSSRNLRWRGLARRLLRSPVPPKSQRNRSSRAGSLHTDRKLPGIAMTTANPRKPPVRRRLWRLHHHRTGSTGGASVSHRPPGEWRRTQCWAAAVVAVRRRTGLDLGLATGRCPRIGFALDSYLSASIAPGLAAVLVAGVSGMGRLTDSNGPAAALPTLQRQPLWILAIGPLFAAMAGIGFKEFFCFRRPEAIGLTLLLPIALLGRLSNLLQQSQPWIAHDSCTTADDPVDPQVRNGPGRRHRR